MIINVTWCLLLYDAALIISIQHCFFVFIFKGAFYLLYISITCLVSLPLWLSAIIICRKSLHAKRTIYASRNFRERTFASRIFLKFSFRISAEAEVRPDKGEKKISANNQFAESECDYQYHYTPNGVDGRPLHWYPCCGNTRCAFYF